MKNITLKVILSFSILSTSLLAGGWVKDPNINGLYTLTHNGEKIATYYNLPQFSQENSYSCGQTTIGMQFVGETNKFGDPILVSTNYITKLANKIAGRDEGAKHGISSVYMSKVISKLSTILNDIGYDNKVFMKEKRGTSIAKSVKIIKDSMGKNFSPGILYGNVPVNGRAGMHYYLIRASVYCSSCRNGAGLYAVSLNDSVYNSDYYKNHNRALYDESATPYAFIYSHKESVDKNGHKNYKLDRYWKPVGGSNYRGHHLLINNSSL